MNYAIGAGMYFATDCIKWKGKTFRDHIVSVGSLDGIKGNVRTGKFKKIYAFRDRKHNFIKGMHEISNINYINVPTAYCI